MQEMRLKNAIATVLDKYDANRFFAIARFMLTVYDARTAQESSTFKAISEQHCKSQ